ncbi:hypothetical protein PCI56_13675 [Plesiomonas shigelloides subsp. oncorhynchi]|nr:hypothetical protein [Plesiomonas shigelloides]
MAQNCPQFTAALVKRWDELESKKAAVPAIPSTYAEALLEAGRLALEVESAMPHWQLLHQRWRLLICSWIPPAANLCVKRQKS